MFVHKVILTTILPLDRTGYVDLLCSNTFWIDQKQKQKFSSFLTKSCGSALDPPPIVLSKITTLTSPLTVSYTMYVIVFSIQNCSAILILNDGTIKFSIFRENAPNIHQIIFQKYFIPKQITYNRKYSESKRI